MEYKAFKELTKEERSEIVEALIVGKHEIYVHDQWFESATWIDPDAIYRVKPAKKLDIPWKIIKPEYKWAAMDKSGKICVFTSKPGCGDVLWYVVDNGDFEHIVALSIDTTGISWENSLTQRPEGI